MHYELLFILILLFGTFVLVMIAQQIRIAYPIFLVIAGLIISFIPGMPTIHLDPDLIFLIFLPPLLYETAWYTSWNDFWKWKRTISLLAFGLVFFTSFIVALSSNYLIPGFTIALGFMLGGIISPPDAIAATSVLKNLKVPKRLLTILEGESLINDASSLIVFRFALAAVLTGAFSMHSAVSNFFMVAFLGVMVGMVGAMIFHFIHKYLPTTPAIDAAITVMSPYVLFLTAEMFHLSGVMAVVTGGLIMSYNAHRTFRSGGTRMNMLGVWTTLIFILNALVFILIGLELPDIVQGLGERTIVEGIQYGLIICGIVIIVRFFWIYSIIYLPLFFKKRALGDTRPNWRASFILSWAGMRGVVSLATALSIPLYLADGTPFPHRNFILLITFVVIFVTLVIQGLSLPIIIKVIKLKEPDESDHADIDQTKIQIALNQFAVEYIQRLLNNDQSLASNDLVKIYLNNLKDLIDNDDLRLKALIEEQYKNDDIKEYHDVLISLYNEQREMLFNMRKSKLFSDHEIRRAQEQIDLNELKITSIQR